MLVVNRFAVPEADTPGFVDRARAALRALAGRPGYRRGALTRALEDPLRWCLVTEWESVGTYRRALGSFEVKVDATPLLAESLDEPSAYEELVTAGPGEEPAAHTSDRAAEPER
ncbi:MULTISPECIES: antibiotic biosynthesis monooxygenase [unclassified Solwaraspora]|uniref:antibiotic biosynthesis monooxygenase family protein n=1 Tax=unclassified Solwaraspora TaxID=2627926 RepID=UPI00248CD5A5|nr:MULTISPECIES: antibiotic biosynthesis monooxygenase [unclassified Solwaraspora]WBB95370.1 antibiotic biosynthesis monooxygenase [Solwaraspora sp. WMMA2059]WBC20724.1 antibiotic biosynthesis monooxygenase [Solwaraspora sp. WMMA2080]WJK37143.1 antibiotic biosynthesis monooxygenase [Solwaraspora sp. WMMA2065]